MDEKSNGDEPRRIALLLGHDSQLLILSQPDANALRIVRSWIRRETGRKDTDELPPELVALVSLMQEETKRVRAGRKQMSVGGLVGMETRWRSGGEDKVGMRSDKVGIRSDKVGIRSDKPEPHNNNHKDISQVSTTSFLSFWNVYPRKVAKADAAKAWRAAWNAGTIDKQNVETVLAAVRRSAASADWTKDGGQFVPHPATWIRGRRWEDEPAPAPPSSPPSPPAFDPGFIPPRRA